jgi:ribosomal protein L40E
MARKRTIGYVQLEWTCPNCSTRNPGGNKTCLNCGAPQPEKVQFERAADEKLVRDENALKAARSGADFICPYCDTRNRADAKTCTQCGGDLVEARRRAAGGELQRHAGPKEIACNNCGTANPAANTNCSKCGAALPRAAAAASAITPSARAGGVPRKKVNWLLIGGILGGLLLCCVAAVALFALPTSSVTATVTNVYWQTSVPVQEIRAVSYSNEAGSPPSDAYNVSCHTDSREVCEERTIDQGNGYAEVVEECHNETEEYCSYTRDEWTTVQTYTLDGNNLFPVYSDPTISGGQRLGTSSDVFTVYFSTEDGQKSYSPGDLSEFQRFQVGTTWTLKLNALGAVVDVQ